MTTIAFDGKILAADTSSWCGETRMPMGRTKIEIHGRDYLITGAGAAPAWRMLAKWWIAESVGKTGWYDPPPKWDGGGYGISVIERSGATYSVDKEGCRLQETAPWAEGSGADIARGALYAGATAVEAVRAACALNAYTRGPIDYVIVAEDPWVIRQVPDRPAWDGNYTFPVRREGDGLDEVRLAGRANGGSAPHSPHEGQA